MDNLARDVRDALRLGYGCHYGRYKADHPYTADTRVEAKPPEDLPTIAPQKCKTCGKEFEPDHGGQRYCSDACKAEAKRKQNTESKRKKVIGHGPAVCPGCGKTFQRDHMRRKYCSCACGEKARRRAAKASAH